MLDNKLDIVVDRLVSILDKNSSDIGDVLKILNDQEIFGLQDKFSDIPTEFLFDQLKLNDIKIKADAISSLIPVLLNNPKILNSLEDRDGDKSQNTRNLLKELYQISYDLGKTLFLNNIYENSIERLSVLVLSSINGVLADKVTEIDCFISDHLEQFNSESISSKTDLEQLIYKCYFLILLLLRKVRLQSDKDVTLKVINECHTLLETVQNFESDANELNLETGFLIGGLANIVYILGVVRSYIYTGKTDTESGIYPMLETYCFNAIKLLENTQDVGLIKISNLLKFGLERICRNSIWEITNRSPLIRQFFESSIKSKDNLILSLLPSQRDSILEILTTKKCIVLNMPTSSGKSLLAELYILFTIQNYSTKDYKPTICYLVPTNALINQVKKRLNKQFKDFLYRIETVLPFYDVDEIEEEILSKDHIDILISTPEKLDFLIRKDHPSLKTLKLVVFDEAHNLSDPERGPKFELLLATIKLRRKDVNFFLLSPFIQNYREIAEWLGDTRQDTTPINLFWSPTKQFIGCNLLNKEKTTDSVKYFPSASNNIVKEPIEIDLNINPMALKRELGERRFSNKIRNLILADKYLDIGGAILFLCEGPGATESLARLLLKYFKSDGKLNDISDHPDIQKAITLIRFESSDDSLLVECLKYGIAFHHSKLSSLVKEEIENLVSCRLVRVLCATTTLAQGMNFPITTVVFDIVKIGPRNNSRKITGPEFWNIAGRAGRAYMDNEGHIIIGFQRNNQETESITKSFIEDHAKKVVSSLNTFFNTLSDDVEFNTKFITNNPSASSFLQYLNHIIRVTYNYKFDSVDTSAIRNILNSSLFYKELTFKEGFIESQERISAFSYRYVKYLKGQNTGQLTLADLFGISNISMNFFSQRVHDFTKEVSELEGNKRDEFIKVSKIILESKNNERLARIIDLIHLIPEMKLELYRQGKFNAESVAKIIIGWVNGKNIEDIARDIKYEGVKFEDILGRCHQYVNATLKSYVPWGFSIYQELTKDQDTEDSKNLPSYIYYGVNHKDLVVLSKIGIPRFALSKVRELYNEHNPSIPITINNLNIIKEKIKMIKAKEYDFADADNEIVKKIIDKEL